MYKCLIGVLAISALVTPWILCFYEGQESELDNAKVQQLTEQLSRSGQEIEQKNAEVQQLTKQLSRSKKLSLVSSLTGENQSDVSKQKSAEVQQLIEQLQKMKQFSKISSPTDTEIARRFAKLPHSYFTPKNQAELLEKLIPDALGRWTCGIKHNHADDEKLLRQHPAMHSNLDGQAYFDRLKSLMQIYGWQRLQNKVFLEVGFGIGLTAALLRGLNTTVYATEIAPVPWTPMRHGPFFEVLVQQAGIAATEGLFGPHFDLELASAYSHRCGQGVPGVSELRTTFEQLEGVSDNSVDVSYSLAVLEHISDPPACFKTLARVHRLGSLTCHQVDLRDHTNFTQPWEFLFMSDQEFEQKTIHGSLGHPYFGNRVRISEFLEAARSHGFEPVHIRKQYEPATEEGLRYATEALSKLQELDKTNHRYASWPAADDWRCTSNNMPITGLFICLEYVGSMVEGSLNIPCNEDTWTKKDFRFGYEISATTAN